MLRQIDTHDLKIGMFVHKMGGSWFSHPFWKGRFLLSDAGMLSQIQDSSVPWVTIDTDKGNDVGAAAAAAPAALEEAPAAPPADAPEARRAQILSRARDHEAVVTVRRRAPTALGSLGALHGEIGNAATVAHQAREKMRDCYRQARLGRPIEVAAVAPLVEDMMASIQRHPHAFNGIMRLVKTSDYLHSHALAVSALMIRLAMQLGLPAATIREAGLAGLLMDIGMGHVPSEIYDKAGPMTDAERGIMHSHTRLAHDFLSIEGGIPEAVLDVCQHHHERLDGSGYPNRLSGDQISLFARMAAICDMYDALTSPRAHRNGAEPAGVIALMRDMGGALDQDVLDAFIESVGIYPVGSLVRLASDHLAIVLDQNPKNPVLPRVRKFYAVQQRHRVPPETIDLVYAIGREDIIGNEKPGDWGFNDWDSMSGALWGDALGVTTG